MKIIHWVLVVAFIASLFGCELLKEPIKEVSEAYKIEKDTELVVILQTLLSSNTNQRGDSFATTLKEPIVFKNKVILPKDTQIKGLVKRAVKFEKLGDRASLLLLFDQIVLPDGKRIPILASLDTEEGNRAIRIKGKPLKDATIIGGSALVGSLVGKESLGKMVHRRASLLARLLVQEQLFYQI